MYSARAEELSRGGFRGGRRAERLQRALGVAFREQGLGKGRRISTVRGGRDGRGRDAQEGLIERERVAKLPDEPLGAERRDAVDFRQCFSVRREDEEAGLDEVEGLQAIALLPVALGHGLDGQKAPLEEGGDGQSLRPLLGRMFTAILTS